MKRLFTLIFLTTFTCLMIFTTLDRYVIRSVWAQATQTVPITFTGGTNCTVLISAVVGQRVYVNNGQLTIPAIGTGLTVTFLGGTSTGQGSTCGPPAVTLTQNTIGAFAGDQVGTTGTTEKVYNLSGSGSGPSLVTASGQGLLAQVSGATGAQPVTGFITFIQQP